MSSYKSLTYTIFLDSWRYRSREKDVSLVRPVTLLTEMLGMWKMVTSSVQHSRIKHLTWRRLSLIKALRYINVSKHTSGDEW